MTASAAIAIVVYATAYLLTLLNLLSDEVNYYIYYTSKLSP